MSLHTRQQSPMQMRIYHVIVLTIGAIPFSGPFWEWTWTSMWHLKQPKSQWSSGSLWPKEESLLMRSPCLRNQTGNLGGGLLPWKQPFVIHCSSHEKWWLPSSCSPPDSGGIQWGIHLLHSAGESMQTSGFPGLTLLHIKNNASFWYLCPPPSPESLTRASISF